MNTNIQANYTVFKKEMRKFLKRDIPISQQNLLNNQLMSVIEALQDMNQNKFDMDLQFKIDNMYKNFLPYMVGYWMVNEVPEIENNPRVTNSSA
jgi:hypothetical protein